MLYEVMLHQYKISPNINNLLEKQHAVKVDPFQRFKDHAAPDGIQGMTNVFEMRRAMQRMCGGKFITRQRLRSSC